jgi:choline dehydrogenase-like flavoprotein
MPRISRRQFLRQAGQVSLAVGIGAQLSGLFGCSGSGQSVVTATGSYDAIIVGGGSAGSIVATKLQMAGGGRKRILIIEAGGPTSAAIGGTDFPPWLPAGRTDLTIFDVPGEYSQIAFMPLGKPYQLTEVPFTFQGIGLGGNSQFNGMLFQTNPPQVFDASWPTGWHWADIQPYFSLIRSKAPVTNTPSTDGIAQNTGPAMIAHPLYAKAGWVEGDTSQPFTAPGSIAGRMSPPPAVIAQDRSARISKESIRVARRYRGLRSCTTPRRTLSTSIRPARRWRCITPGAAAWTSRRRAPPAPPGWLPADCW